jgi:RimJ/RimL family protein N-acetyltransferase
VSPPEPASEHPTLTDGTVTLRPVSDDGVAGRFEIEVGDDVVGELGLQRLDPHTVELSWRLNEAVRKRGYATRALRTLVDWALTDTDDGGFGISRVQARVAADNTDALRLATRGGMSREGTQRVVPGTGDREETTEYVVFSRLATDPPLSDPSSFRSLLNAMLPRKRAIGQMLVRDPDGRVLLCQLTYKRDWDLPGGVVEVGENPKEAVAREVTEELGLTIDAGDLLITDWLPPWGGWDDALYKDQEGPVGRQGSQPRRDDQLGLPVPPGFTIDTEACRAYLRAGATPDGLAEQVTSTWPLRGTWAGGSATPTTRCWCRCARGRSSRCPA